MTKEERLARWFNFNPRSPCGERHVKVPAAPAGFEISIHAPRVGSDVKVPAAPAGFEISIHAPRVGSDQNACRCAGIEFDFNPRSPCGERHILTSDFANIEHFNPRSPCGERQHMECVKALYPKISIHAPRVGSDTRSRPAFARYDDFNPRSPCGERPRSVTSPAPSRYFNPRSPCGERPVRNNAKQGGRDISIHAPRVGSDPLPGGGKR